MRRVLIELPLKWKNPKSHVPCAVSQSIPTTILVEAIMYSGNAEGVAKFITAAKIAKQSIGKNTNLIVKV
jgi:hypothetical protein